MGLLMTPVTGGVPPPPPPPPPQHPTKPPGMKLVEDWAYDLAVIQVKTEFEEYKEELKVHKQDQRHNKEADMRMYALVLQHCVPEVEAALKGLSAWTEVKNESSCMKLLKLVRDLTHEHDETKQSTMALVKSDFNLMTLGQEDDVSNEKFVTLVQSQVKTINSHGGQAGYHPALYLRHLERIAESRGIDPGRVDTTNAEQAVAWQEVKEAAMDSSTEEYIASFIILAANDKRYGGLKQELHNQHLIGDGRKVYPDKVPAALQLLNSYKGGKPGGQSGGNVPAGAGLAFVEQGNFGGSCWGCGESHPLHSCPKYSKKEREGIYEARRKSAAESAAKAKEKAGIAQANVEKPAAEVVPPPAKDDAKPQPQLLSYAEYCEKVLASQLDGVGFAEVHGIELLVNGGSKVTFAEGTKPPGPSGVPQRITLDENKLYLDSCATYHTAFVRERLDRVENAGVTLRGNCNAGVTASSEKGWLGDFHMWLNEKGIANLLSLPQLERDGYKVHYDTDGDWVVTSPKGGKVVFTRDTGLCDGMPYIDVRDHATEAFAMIQTVRDNFEHFTKEEIEKAVKARKLQGRVGYPADAKFANLVSSNSLKHSPVTASDAANAHTMFGPNLEGLRGKTVRQRPRRVETGYLRIPRDFYELHKFVTLTADVMFVNGIPFLVTMSRTIKFRTAEFAPSRTKKQLARLLRRVCMLYGRGGFVVRVILMDMEFEKVSDEIGLVEVNTAAAREHVGEIERSIRLMKERARCVVASLRRIGVKFLHKQILIRMVYHVVMWLNAVPADGGVSMQYSPREIVIQTQLDFKKHAVADFGAYVEASEDAVRTNDMSDRTHECINLGPTGNRQGSHYTFDLGTGKVTTRRIIREMPMPDEVVRTINRWGEKGEKARLYASTVEFANRAKQQYTWDNAELDVIPGEQELVHPDIPAEIPGVELERDSDDDAVVQPDPSPSLNARMTRARANALGGSSAQPHESTGVGSTGVAESTGVHGTAQENDEENDATPATQEETHDAAARKVTAKVTTDAVVDLVEEDADDSDDDDTLAPETLDLLEDDESLASEGAGDDATGDAEGLAEETATDGRYPGRNRAAPRAYVPSMAGKRYAEHLIHLEYRGQPYLLEPASGQIHVSYDGSFVPEGLTEEEAEEVIIGMVLAEQHSLKRAARLFGPKAMEAAGKELQQIHDFGTYVPMDPSKLTREEKKKAIEALMFVTEKRNGQLKARKCAVGSKQRTFEGYQKSDGTAPTVSTDSVLITAALEAAERRDVATLDIPGAFLNTDLDDEETIMLLRGHMVELMVQVDPKMYRKHVITSSKGEPLLYVKLSKAIYGLLRSALLFYRKLRGELEAYDFVINPYDPCVANKMVNGKQMTVVWHVDDLKVSHVDKAEVTKFVAHLVGIYGPKMTVNRGTVHDYLGMDLDYSEPGTATVSMIKYLRKIKEEFPEEITGTASTPAADHLFKVRAEEDAKQLPEEQAQQFHRTTAQLLFLSARARPDIKTAVAFLTTRVQKPDEDDWGKLKRVLKYLNGTRHMKLRLTVDDMRFLHWWVDASYGVHWDCRGHTGMMMSLGKGAAMSFSLRHKLNTGSSTEAELVGLYDALGSIMWGRHFIEAQGYTVEQNIVYQDNKSTILLAKNGIMSSTKRTKHINARYFMLADYNRRGDISIQHEGTEKMWCDGFTKPKQGREFCEQRAHVMNCPVEYDDDEERRRTHPLLLPSEAGPVEVSKTLTRALKVPAVSAPADTNRRRSVLVDSQSAKRTSAVRTDGYVGQGTARAMRGPTYGEYVRYKVRITRGTSGREQGASKRARASFGLAFRSNDKLTFNQ